jgi:hypothetical protein
MQAPFFDIVKKTICRPVFDFLQKLLGRIVHLVYCFCVVVFKIQMVLCFQHDLKELSTIKAEIAGQLSESQGKIHVSFLLFSFAVCS